MIETRRLKNIIFLQTIYYRYFKNYDQKKFNDELKKEISIDLSFEAFLEIFQSTLNRFVPYKQSN